MSAKMKKSNDMCLFYNDSTYETMIDDSLTAQCQRAAYSY